MFNKPAKPLNKKRIKRKSRLFKGGSFKGKNGKKRNRMKIRKFRLENRFTEQTIRVSRSKAGSLFGIGLEYAGND
jgi:hypothetical protein